MYGWAEIDSTTWLIAAAIVVPTTALIVFAVIWSNRRAEALLARLAEENGFRIVEKEERQLRRGPFFWTSSKGQVVYHVTVEDQQGQLRRGFVRLGSWGRGIFSDQAEVRWDGE